MTKMTPMSDQKTGAYQPNCFNRGKRDSMFGKGHSKGLNARKRKTSIKTSSERQFFCRTISSATQSTALAPFSKKVLGVSKSNGIRVLLSAPQVRAMRGLQIIE